MNSGKRLVLSVLGILLAAPLLVGCSSGVPIPPATEPGSQEAPPSADAGLQAMPSVPNVPPQDADSLATEQEAISPASPVEQEIVPDVNDEEEEGAPAVVETQETVPSVTLAEPVTGPSVERYAPRTTNGVDVVYFEPTNICACTAKVGDTIEKAVLTYFQDELQSGELRYFLVVSNDPENNDLMKTFDSQPLELRIVEYKDGHTTSEAVNEIWTLKNSPSTLEKFVHTLVQDDLEAQR